MTENRLAIGNAPPQNNHLTILLFLLIYVSNDTYMFGTNSSELIVSIPRYLMLAFCVIEFFVVFNKFSPEENKRKLITYVLLVIVLIIVSYLNGEYYARVFIKILCISGALMLCIRYPFKDYAHSFCFIIYSLSIWAIALTALSYLAPSIVALLPSIVNTANSRIYTGVFAGVLEGNLYSNMIRTLGIFWEPGVYQIYLNIAICFELFINKEPRKKYLSIFIIALILTFSTTGYIAFIWIIATYAIFEKREGISAKKISFIFLLMILLSVGLFVFMDNSIIGQTVFGKLVDPHSGTAMVRKASVFVNLDILKDNPLTGVGMKNIEKEFILRTQASDFYYGFTGQNTNTLLYQFAAHGLMFGLLFAIGTAKFSNNLSNKKVVRICIFLMFVMLYIGENLQVSMLPYIIIFYGFGYKDNIYKTQSNNFNIDKQYGRFI